MDDLQASILEQIEGYVSEKMKGVDASHDMSHICRVLKNARRINEEEHGDVFLIEAGALLHDICDVKLFDKREAENQLMDFFERIGLPIETGVSLLNIINAVSFGAGIEGVETLSLEQKIVRDADRLDAIGAIGIARTFHYGGRKNREMFNDAYPPQTYQTSEDYRNNTSPTIHHFYEKLLLLKDKMETPSGRRMAVERHNYMLGFLKQFYREIDEEGFALDGYN